MEPVSFAADLIDEWTKPASVFWEEPYWSLDGLPPMDQASVAIGAKPIANYLPAEAPADPSNRPQYPISHLDRFSKRQANRPPVASAGGERVAAVGEAVTFYGQGASPDRQIVEYSWDFESDGLIDFESSKTASTTHTFTEPGEYRCLLRVKDSSGQMAQSVRRILVIAVNADRKAAENSLHPITRPGVNLADGFIHRYAILFNGGGEDRFWKDVTLCYTMLTNRYDFSPGEIYLLNYDGSNPNGDNPNGMIDYPATLEGLQTVLSRLATIVDSDDEVFFWITDHGRGYSGPLIQGGRVLGYLDGRASVDPGDEPDFPESDFKLRSLMTYGDYISNHGLNAWKVARSYDAEGKTAFYRNNYVSHFDNVYVETLGAAVSDHDVLIERFVDYARGDTNKDGVIDESIGEVFDYDGDGVPPYDPATGAFDEDDWGQIDLLEDDFNRLNTLLPEGAGAYRLFDSNFEGQLCIDLAYNGGQLHIDGRDEDGLGLFDWMDVNQDGDTNDVVSVDEAISSLVGAIYDDELRTMLSPLSAAKITIVAEPCFSGGLVEDLSATNRVICTATVEDALSYGNLFIRGFVAALHGQDEYGSPVDADKDRNGAVSMVEAFNYAVANDYYDEIPQYDDNGDGISRAGPVPVGPEGLLGANTYLSGGAVTSNVVNEWTKSTSGYWEEPYWSLGLPNSFQTVEFTNAGWKALTIGANTVNNYPNSLTVNRLTVNAPADSFNLLLLNYAGFKAPLTVNSDLTVGTNGSLLSYYTALQGSNFYLASSAGFSEGSAITFSNIVLQSNTLAQLNLTNSSLWAGSLTLNPTGILNQIGGSVQISSLRMYGGAYGNPSTYYLNGGSLQVGDLVVDSAAYHQVGGAASISTISHLPKTEYADSSDNYFYLSDGTLVSGAVSLGRGYYKSRGDHATFYQSGGVHNNSSITLQGGVECCPSWISFGKYFLSGGTLISGVMTNSGAVTQSGGTNCTGELTLSYSGLYTLNAGALVTSNTTVQYSYSEFVQNGGNHSIENRLLLTGYSCYSLAAGSLSVPIVELSDDAQMYLHGGAVSNSGSIILNVGRLIMDGPAQQFGKLEVRTRAALYAGNQSRSGDSLPGPPTTGRFQDSHEVEWTGMLSIYLWSPYTNDASGPDHIFVGTNSQGLSAAQLTQVKFINPAGWPSGSYAARMLPTGELVPAVPPLAITRLSDRVILSWQGDYELVTATNVTGPYFPMFNVASPLTNMLIDPQRYFRLRLTIP